jgi:acetoin utilization deacetylase AcuC-like enzyme
MIENLVYFYPEGHAGHYEHGHPERPERVEVIRTALSENGLWDGYSKLSALKVDDDLIQSIHSTAYLNLLEMTCRRAGHLDADTYTTHDSWNLARQSVGGAVAVASAVWQGMSKRGFALTRPPGHHAMRGQGMGFCLLNNIAIAAEYLIKYYQVERLAIIDLDLHHGNGTQEIFWTRDDVFYISTHQYPFYPGTGGVEDIGAGIGEGWTANFPLQPGSGDTAFITIMDELILPLLVQKHPQMLLVSFGFDPHWLDPLGHLLLTAEGYRVILLKLCKWADIYCDGRIALFLEGGYDLNAGKACSLAVVSAMINYEFDDPYPCPYQENNSWKSMMKHAHTVWNI